MITASNLTKIFHDKKRGEIRAVDSVSIECRPGRVFGLLGLNGAGKTTLMRLLSTILKPTSGTANVAGYDILKEPEKAKERIGFLSSTTGLYPRLTAEETVRYFGRLNGMDERKLEEKLDLMFDRFEMNEFRKRKVDKLSSGMKQKVSIARTFVNDPEVLILDEPTLGLDVVTSRNIIEFIRESKQANKCLLFSTHVMWEAQKLCDDIAIIHRGRILEVGTLDLLRTKTGMADLDDIFVNIIGEQAAMNFRKIKIIYFKEMLETLRDRRTIISSVLIPILLFPVLMFGIGMIMQKAEEKSKAKIPQITVIGETQAPSFVSFLRLSNSFEIVKVGDFKSALNRKEINAALEFPDGFEGSILSGKNSEATIYYDAAESRSDIARNKLKDKLKEYQDSLVTGRLKERGLERSVLNPVKINETNLAPQEKMGGFMLGMFLPYMIVILAMVGAMYPAIDLTAGEKERGTLETLLVTPVSRLDISTGKFLAVLTASVVTVVLSITSMSISTIWGFAQMNRFASEQIPITIKPLSILLVFVLMVPLAAIFSSALLSVCLFAKSFKEAHSYVSPLMFLIILPAMVSFIPGMELSWSWAFVPIVNVCLAAREVLVGTFRWGFIGIIFLSTFIYASFSIFVTKRLFEKEEVLFRT